MNDAVLSDRDIDALGARAEAMIAELGEISAEPGRLVRLFLSKEHRRAADLAGMFDPATLALADRDGITYAAALAAYGKNADDIASAAYSHDQAAAYVEVHIEQGPTLEVEGEPLGVVSGIIGQNKMQVIVEGE